jgi:hypothetical protein
VASTQRQTVSSHRFGHAICSHWTHACVYTTDSACVGDVSTETELKHTQDAGSSPGTEKQVRMHTHNRRDSFGIATRIREDTSLNIYENFRFPTPGLHALPCSCRLAIGEMDRSRICFITAGWIRVRWLNLRFKMTNCDMRSWRPTFHVCQCEPRGKLANAFDVPEVLSCSFIQQKSSPGTSALLLQICHFAHLWSVEASQEANKVWGLLRCAMLHAGKRKDARPCNILMLACPRSNKSLVTLNLSWT